MSSFENVSKNPVLASDSPNPPESEFATKTPVKTAILPIISRDSEIAISFHVVKPYCSPDRNVQIKPVKRQIFTSPRKPETIVKLPERFKILDQFFNALDTVIRLLKLKASLTSFANIRPKIEYLTKRIFSYEHLAQMKHICPEAIEVKRVLKCDEDTSCMKPYLHIDLNTDAIVLEDTSCGTKYMQLRKVFHSKLVDFYNAHPKDEIPKELLHEPFNSAKRDSYSESKAVDLGATKVENDGFDVQVEGKIEQEEDSYSETTTVDLGTSKLENDGYDVQMEEMVEQEEDKVNEVIPDSTLSEGTKECLLPHTDSRIVGTPAKDLSTPSKDVSTPIRLMSATPTMQQSRRCITMTPDDDNDSVRSTDGLERLPCRTRCLNFDTLVEDEIAKIDISNESNDESADEGVNYEADDASSDEDRLLHSMIEKPKTKPEKQKLPKLVSLIHKWFHSSNRTIITKEELLHKMIACQIDITDRKEVEEQLRLMLQLVPDWISETKASSCDFLVRINKMSTAETVSKRLEEATSQGISTVY